MKGNARLMTQSGFSLIELMVVVAIIGILATVAIPNFNKFTNKAKQSEAKSALSALYSSEKAFFAEWSTYYSGFADIGYIPEGKANYHSGFAALTATTAAMTAAGFNAAPVANKGGACFTTAVCGTLSPAFTPTAAASATLTGSNTPNATVFTAAAASQLEASSPTTDIWTITENKLLRNSQPGL